MASQIWLRSLLFLTGGSTCGLLGTSIKHVPPGHVGRTEDQVIYCEGYHLVSPFSSFVKVDTRDKMHSMDTSIVMKTGYELCTKVHVTYGRNPSYPNVSQDDSVRLTREVNRVVRSIARTKSVKDLYDPKNQTNFEQEVGNELRARNPDLRFPHVDIIPYRNQKIFSSTVLDEMTTLCLPDLKELLK